MHEKLAGFVQQLALLETEQQWEAVVDACQHWLTAYPNNSYHPYANQVHKRLIRGLIEHGSFAAAFSAYGLVRQDQKALAIHVGELLCCVTVRNEALRLPYFLDYYRQKGVTRFLVVDNGSLDETLTYLLAQADVYVWSADYSFKAANFGAAWFELLLQRYGIGHWVLMVDADELLYYPACEQTSLPQWCQTLERQNAKAYKAILLDMYADRAIQETHYKKGQDFLSVCPYFDRQFYHNQATWGPFKNQMGYWGGVRKRVFGGTEWDYCLNKVPLLYYSPACILIGGQHGTSYPVEQISTERGCVLHFKFFASFPQYAASEATRQEHAAYAIEYRQYAEKLADEQALTLYDPEQSLRFQDSHQLIALGIMQRQQADDENMQESSTKLLIRHKQMMSYIKLAESWLVKGDLQRVLAYYEKIIELDPKCLPAYLRLAYILQENDRLAEARSYAVQALTLAPANIPLQNMLDNLHAALAGRA